MAIPCIRKTIFFFLKIESNCQEGDLIKKKFLKRVDRVNRDNNSYQVNNRKFLQAF